jgi:hypothetical protein
MLELWHHLLSSDFMPHGHCYLWQPPLVWLEVVTNTLIGLAYLSISVTLAWLVRTVRDLPFEWVYLAFGIFIVTCGFTHFMDVWVIWHPAYWVDVGVRAVTALASVGTAILLFPLFPRAVALADAARLAHDRGLRLEQLNDELEALYAKTRETLAEAIPQLVWTARPDGSVDYLNQRWVEFTGARALGHGWEAAIHPEDAARVRELWRGSLAGGVAYETEYRLRARDGGYRWFLARALPLRDSDRIVKWFGTCTDIHDRKLLDEEREQMLGRAREDVRARDVFLAIAAHELRTPLTPLRLEIEGVLRVARGRRADRLTPELVRARLGVVERQIGRMERLVANLLDVTRLTTGQFALQREEAELGALVQEIVERHRVEREQAGSALTLHLAPEVVGCFDRLRLDEVVTNLLGNALVHGRGKPITITLTTEPGTAVLTVADEGPGVAAEDRQRIFERFERAASVRHGGGLGLGLWLARRLVEEHGGTVDVEGEPGQGARFTVRLPLRDG